MSTFTIQSDEDQIAALEALEELEAESDDWRDWLSHWFPHVATHPPSRPQTEMWEWMDALRPGIAPRAKIVIVARGGGKSVTAELGCVRLAERLTRRFVLIVSNTQAQADKHVVSIAAFMSQRGISRAIGKYGRAKAWNRQQLHTREGFNVAGFGLDTATRGVRVEQYRPDLVILDDVDNEGDSPLIIRQKIDAITTAILPAGSNDCGVLFVQNLVHEDSIMSQIVDGRADFLRNREVMEPEPAIRNLTFEDWIDEETGNTLYRITGGEATWEGQPIEALEDILNVISWRAFAREYQHEVGQETTHCYFEDVGSHYLHSLIDPETMRCSEPIEKYDSGWNGLSGTLLVWERPKPGCRYFLGADVAEGLRKEKSDESTQTVLCVDPKETRRVRAKEVAVYFGKPDPRAFGLDIFNVSEWYNRALIAVENNTFGTWTLATLEDLNANVWYSDPEGSEAGPQTPDYDQSAGMRTTKRSKGQVDGELRAAIIDAAMGRPSIQLQYKGTVEQCLHYVNLPNGGRGGERNWKDDIVRSLGLAWWLAKDYSSYMAVRPKVANAGLPYGGYYRLRRCA